MIDNNKKTEFYRESISTIASHYGVSDDCALYLYHRAYRNKQKDERYLSWNVQLQNAIVMADKCLGIDWKNIHFGSEEKALATYDIIINEMPKTVFRWTENNKESSNNDWTVIVSKNTKKKNKSKKINLMMIKRPGLFV